MGWTSHERSQKPLRRQFPAGTFTHGKGSIGIACLRKRLLAVEILHAALPRAGVEWRSNWTRHLLRPDLEPVEAQVTERPPLTTVAVYWIQRAAS